MIDICKEGDTLEVGIRYRKYNTSGGFLEFTHNGPSVLKDIYVENQWVREELTRTDTLIMLPDYPYVEKLIAYREELRYYNGVTDRPVTPTTNSGEAI